MWIKYDDGTQYTALYVDHTKAAPHGFRFVFWRSHHPKWENRPTFWGTVISVTDDFGDTVPAYLPAVLNLKQEGH